MQRDFVTLKRIIIKTTTPGVRRSLLFTRDKILDYHARWRNLNGWSGSLPNFLIVGTQKGGTTELYEQLIQHPNVIPAFVKEVHFFDANYHKGLGWYSAFFPQRLEACGRWPGEYMTGEASPCYLFHPHAAVRVRKTVPHARIIMLLRNPVDRAYSHYHHEVRLGYETLSFQDAIALEAERLAGEKEKMLAHEGYYSRAYMHHSYLHRGIYLDQIKPWFENFSEDQILVLQSEDFFGDTPEIMRQVYAFLGIEWPTRQGQPDRGRPPCLPATRHGQNKDEGRRMKDEESISPRCSSPGALCAPHSSSFSRHSGMNQHKAFPYPKMDKAMRQVLEDYFAPHNRALFDYLGREFSWR